MTGGMFLVYIIIAGILASWIYNTILYTQRDKEERDRNLFMYLSLTAYSLILPALIYVYRSRVEDLITRGTVGRRTILDDIEAAAKNNPNIVNWIVQKLT